MINEQVSLRKAITQAPDDDAPRLIYADWLQEQGEDDRAEFIRRQVALARMNPWDAGYTSAALACDDLLLQHREWYGPWESQVHTILDLFNHGTPDFARGFIHHVKVDPAAFLQFHDNLLNEMLVQQLHLDCTNGVRDRAKDLAKFAALRELDILYAQPRDSRRIGKMLERITTLDHLGLRGCHLEPRWMMSLLRSPHSQTLRSFSLGGTPWHPDEEATWQQTKFPQLRHFTRVGSLGVDWLRLSWVRSLASLHIQDGRFNMPIEERAAIADVLPECALRSLRLSEWNFDADGAERFVQAINRSPLESLAIAHTRIDPALLATIVTRLQRPLQALTITGADLQESFTRAFVESPLTESVRLLWLNRINGEGLRMLANQRTPNRVESLRLGLTPAYRNEEEADSLRTLLGNPAWQHLRSLTLYTAQYNESEMAPLESEGWVNAIAQTEHPLEELRLDVRGLRESSASLFMPLAARPTFKKLLLRGHTEAKLFARLQPDFGHRVVHTYSVSYM